MSLHRAAADGDEEQLAALLAAGADVNARDDDDYTPLHVAARHGSVALIQLLVAAGARVDARATPQHLTPLHTAASADSAACCRALLAAGASVNARANSFWTPLHYAAVTNGTCIAALAEAGADMNARCYKGRTPMGQAMRFMAVSAADNLREAARMQPQWRAQSRAVRAAAAVAKRSAKPLDGEQQYAENPFQDGWAAHVIKHVLAHVGRRDLGQASLVCKTWLRGADASVEGRPLTFYANE